MRKQLNMKDFNISINQMVGDRADKCFHQQGRSQDFFEGGSDLKWNVFSYGEGLGASPRPCLDENDAYTKCALRQ